MPGLGNSYHPGSRSPSFPAGLIGNAATPGALATRLRNGLYAEGKSGLAVGTFKVTADALEIRPGPASFFHHGEIREGPVELKFPTVENTSSGHLRIQTVPPGLEVSVDGKSIGQSPINVSLPAGEHTCQLTPPAGGTPVERTVQITANATTTLSIRY